MIENNLNFSTGLSLRPAASGDQTFLQTLYRNSRPDLELIEGNRDWRHHIAEQQYHVLETGTNSHYPNAMHFVIEKAATRIGSIVVDFGHNEVRIAYLAFIREARGRGYGKEVLRGMQQAAKNVRCPLVGVVWRNNPQAKKLYLELGFRVAESQVVAERLIWYPQENGIPRFVS